MISFTRLQISLSEQNLGLLQDAKGFKFFSVQFSISLKKVFYASQAIFAWKLRERLWVKIVINLSLWECVCGFSDWSKKLTVGLGELSQSERIEETCQVGSIFFMLGYLFGVCLELCWYLLKLCVNLFHSSDLNERETILALAMAAAFMCFSHWFLHGVAYELHGLCNILIGKKSCQCFWIKIYHGLLTRPSGHTVASNPLHNCRS